MESGTLVCYGLEGGSWIRVMGILMRRNAFLAWRCLVGFYFQNSRMPQAMVSYKSLLIALHAKHGNNAEALPWLSQEQTASASRQRCRAFRKVSCLDDGS